jgi:hypothetical protein
MFYWIKRVYRPEFYHGPHKPKNYFEGWYYKFVAPGHAFAVIPGVSWAPADPHSFIQTIDGKTGKATYERYDITAFDYDRGRFVVRLGESEFTLEGMRVRTGAVNADIELRSVVRWPTSLFAPGTMGWYSFVPFMECKHGILAMDGVAEGRVNGSTDVSGRIYIEKDYGRSFPQGWIWAQSNNFVQDGVSVTCSVAKVPFLGGAFTGFLIGFLWGDTLYRFTTYTGARMERLIAGSDEAEIVVRDKRRQLRIVCHRAHGSELASPTSGEMLGRIEESLASHLEVEFSEDGAVRFSGTGSSAGLEIVHPEVLQSSR